MEAVPRLPMLSFELKTSDEKPNFHSKLKDYIQNHYNEDGEAFSMQLSQLEGLRASAVRPARDVTGCSTLKRYYCQLHFLLTRFPMNKSGDAAVNFSWRDAYSDVTVSGSDVTIELAAILYNIGALHTQLGADDDRTDPDNLRIVCSHFQCAAWAFQHITEEFPQILSYDPSCHLLNYLSTICLAQAQECFLEKGMLDNRKGSIVAKISAQTVEFYRQALKMLTTSSNDDITIADTVGSKLKKKWDAYLKFKICYYSCLTLLHQGQQAEEEQKMGERVGYYQAAFDKLTEAAKLAKPLDNFQLVSDTLTFTEDVVAGKRKIATNENEFIYHEEIPAANTLPVVQPASLVKPTGFNVNDPDISGPDIFARLIPLTAHESSSVYSEQLADMLRNITSDVMTADEQLDVLLSTIHVQGPADVDATLPQPVLDRCAAMSANPDGIENLQEMMNSLSETYQDVEAMLLQINALLKKEDEDAQGYEDVVGARPPSIAATDLTREANKYQDAHGKASESNASLHKAMQKHMPNLRLLMLPVRELEMQLPKIEIDPGEDAAIFEKMALLMDKVTEMRQQRGVLVAQLREAVNRDDITQKIVIHQDEKQDLFASEMAKHQPQINLIKQNIAAQENILKAVQDTYALYGQARRNLNSKNHRRDALLSSLEYSYDAFEDLTAKSNKGLEFYKKLHGNVSKLLQRVRSTCKVQEEEREQVLSTIRPKRNNQLPVAPSSCDLPPPGRIYNDVSSGSGLKLKDYLNMKKETGRMSLVTPPPTTGAQPWVPGIRPAPVGSEAQDSAPPRADAYAYSYANYKAPEAYCPPYSTVGGYGNSTAPMNNQKYANNQYYSGAPYGTTGFPEGNQQPISYENSSANLITSQPSYQPPYGTTNFPESNQQPYGNMVANNQTSQPSYQPSYGTTNFPDSNQQPVSYGNMSAATTMSHNLTSQPSYQPPYSPQPSLPYYPTTSVQNNQNLATNIPSSTYNQVTSNIPPSSAAPLPYASIPSQPTNYPPSVSNSQVYYQTTNLSSQNQAPNNIYLGLNQQPSYNSNQVYNQTSTNLSNHPNNVYQGQQPTNVSSNQAATTDLSSQNPNMYQGYQQPTNPPTNVSSNQVYNQASSNLSNKNPNNVYQGQQPTNASSNQLYNQAATTDLSNQNQGFNQMGSVHQPPTSHFQMSTSQQPQAPSNIPPENLNQTSPNFNQPTSGLHDSAQTNVYNQNYQVPSSVSTPNYYPTSLNQTSNFQGSQIHNPSNIPAASGYPAVVGPLKETFPPGCVQANVSAVSVAQPPTPTIDACAKIFANATDFSAPTSSLLGSGSTSLGLDMYLDQQWSSNYMPQQTPAYQQEARPHGSATMYTHTPLLNVYTPVSSDVYLNPPNSLNLSAVPPSPLRDDSYSWYAGNHAATQSPVTYKQAGYMIDANTTTTNTADVIKSFPAISTGQQQGVGGGQNQQESGSVQGGIQSSVGSVQGGFQNNVGSVQGGFLSSVGGVQNQHESGSVQGSFQSNVGSVQGGVQNIQESEHVGGVQNNIGSVQGGAQKIHGCVSNQESVQNIKTVTSHVDLLAGLEMSTMNLSLSDTPKKTETTKPVQEKSEVSLQVSQIDKHEPARIVPRELDTATLTAFIPQVDKLAAFVAGLPLKTLNGPTALDLLWKEITDSQERDSIHRSISVARCYPMKNRYPDILPYDESRIELPSTKDDYINASYLKPITNGLPGLIVTQAPLPVTCSDLWTMVLERNVEVMICLLSQQELGSDVYWPIHNQRPICLSNVKVSLQACNDHSSWTERILCVTDGQVTRVVVHLQFNAWPASMLPASPSPFVSFVQEVKSFFTQQRNPSHPAVVHCLSGVGRSGLFSVLINVITDIENTASIPDVMAIITKVSNARKNCLRDRDHLKFLYQCILYFCQDLLVKRGIVTSSSTDSTKPSLDLLASASTPPTNTEGPMTSSFVDINKLSMLPSESPGKRKAKFTPESFTKGAAGLAQSGGTQDPLSSLDPLWSMKK